MHMYNQLTSCIKYIFRILELVCKLEQSDFNTVVIPFSYLAWKPHKYVCMTFVLCNIG